MESTNPYEVALEILREGGWCKNHFKSGKHHCLLSAIAISSGDAIGGTYISSLTHSSPICRVLQDVYGDDSLTRFNDNPHTSFKDVESVLLRSAKLWDQEMQVAGL